MYETCYHLYKLLKKVIIFYPVRKHELLSPKIYNPENKNKSKDAFLLESEKTVAKWVYINNESAGATTNTLSNSKGIYFAIRKENHVYGVVGIDMSFNENNEISLSEKSLLLAMLNEIALAFDSIENWIF